MGHRILDMGYRIQGTGYRVQGTGYMGALQRGYRGCMLSLLGRVYREQDTGGTEYMIQSTGKGLQGTHNTNFGYRVSTEYKVKGARLQDAVGTVYGTCVFLWFKE